MVLLEPLAIDFNLNRSLRVNARGSIEIVDFVLLSFLYGDESRLEDYGITATLDGHIGISLREREENFIDQ